MTHFWRGSEDVCVVVGEVGVVVGRVGLVEAHEPLVLSLNAFEGQNLKPDNGAELENQGADWQETDEGVAGRMLGQFTWKSQ